MILFALGFVLGVLIVAIVCFVVLIDACRDLTPWH